MICIRRLAQAPLPDPWIARGAGREARRDALPASSIFDPWDSSLLPLQANQTPSAGWRLNGRFT
jgi:hypothetical protein